MSNREQERLRRLREQQLQSRDPHVKQRKIQRNITAIFIIFGLVLGNALDIRDEIRKNIK